MLDLLTSSIPQTVADCQALGAGWIAGGNQLAILVPSVVIPEEFNILLNPNHSAYSSLAWIEPRAFFFDPRLFIAEPQTL